MTQAPHIQAPVIDLGVWPDFEQRHVSGAAGVLSVRIAGPATAPAVLMNHSILTSSAIWRRQATLLVTRGFRVICLDTRGHGSSPGSPAPYAMDDLVGDNVVVLDTLGIGRAHFVGVSQGGMTGFGLGARHPERLESLCVVAARADAPAPFAAAWDERIALVLAQGVRALAQPTAERWFGQPFLDSNPLVARTLLACIGQTTAEGFVGCARAIQALDYLGELHRIDVRTSLLIGSRDEALLQPMREIAPLMPNATFEIIADAGHLPQLDQPDAVDAALLRHLAADKRKAA